MDEIFLLSNRKRLTLKRGKERVVTNRHPWIFAGAIGAEGGPPEAAIGDLFDVNGVRLASGFYSPRSEIRLRALTFGQDELTAELIAQRIDAAIARRRRLLGPNTNAIRMINADGDDLSGLVIDLYNDVVVAEIANAGIERLKPMILDTIRRALNPRLIYLSNDMPARRLEQLATEPEAIGEGTPATTILENGLRFEVDPASGQKTGFFLDQRENRTLAQSLAPGRRMLNLFSYTGAFGVYAAGPGHQSGETQSRSERLVDHRSFHGRRCVRACAPPSGKRRAIRLDRLRSAGIRETESGSRPRRARLQGHQLVRDAASRT
ncbi:MAG: hypothetical protein DMF58_10850 [Acidobacteria bacterium]|nr:MAG: hypothetical protein DMF58_10850 [Acidobacteriota bacterium]